MELENDFAHSIQFLLVEEEIISGFDGTFPPGLDFMLGGGVFLNNEYTPLDMDFPTYLPDEENTAVIAYDGEAKTIQFILNGELLPNWIVAESLTPRKIKIRVTGLQVKVSR
jgi:hypothetical protein